VGAYVAYELLTSKYESTALIQVDQAPSSVASNNPNQARTDFSTYMNTARTKLRSEQVLSRALREIKDITTIKAQKDPIKFLTEELQISAQSGDEIIKVTFASHIPGDAKKVVDAVQAAFMMEAEDAEAKQRNALIEKIRLAKEAMAQRLSAFNEKKPDTTKAGLGQGANPAVGGGPPIPPLNAGLPGPVVNNAIDAPAALPIAANAGVPTNAMEHLLRNPTYHQQMFVQAQSRLKQIPDEAQGLIRQAQEIEARITKLQSSPPNDAEIAAVQKDQTIQNYARLVSHFQNQYNSLCIGSAESPAAIKAKQTLDGVVAALHAEQQTKARGVAEINRAPQLKQYESEHVAIRRQLATLEAEEKRLRLQAETAQKVLLILPPPIERGGPGDPRGPLDRPYDVAQTQLLAEDSVLAGIDRNYWSHFLELTAPSRVRVVQPGSTPTQKDTKKQIIGTIAASLLGFAIIALGVVGYETVTKRVSSLGDLKSTSPAPVVGVIPCLPGDANGRDPARRAAANEAIDKLRAYVAQSWLSRGATCVAVTSPLGDEGKAFTSFGLASSMAQAGYKTLLVDFDLRDPIMHTYAGVSNEIGMCEVLRGETDARRAVVALPNGLDLLPAGRWSDEARQAAVGGRLDALLNRLKSPYDCVILHAHALLTVAEAVEVARQCEVVLVCALYRETKLPLLRKATDRVATMEVPYSGIVYVGATSSESLC
jgi:Mrp family chromosome partitioning ATPase